jgi:hypothetical protein
VLLFCILLRQCGFHLPLTMFLIPIKVIRGWDIPSSTL